MVNIFQVVAWNGKSYKHNVNIDLESKRELPKLKDELKKKYSKEHNAEITDVYFYYKTKL